MKQNRRVAYFVWGICLKGVADTLMVLKKLYPNVYYSETEILGQVGLVLDLFLIAICGFALVQWAVGSPWKSYLVVTLVGVNTYFSHVLVRKNPGLGWLGLFEALPVPFWILVGVVSSIVFLGYHLVRATRPENNDFGPGE